MSTLARTDTFKEGDVIIYMRSVLESKTKYDIPDVYKIREFNDTSAICDIVGSEKWTTVPNQYLDVYMLYNEALKLYPEYFI